VVEAERKQAAARPGKISRPAPALNAQSQEMNAKENAGDFQSRIALAWELGETEIELIKRIAS